MSSDTPSEAALEPISGWHVGHFFYRFNRIQLRSLGPNELSDGCREFARLLDPAAEGAPTKLQTWIISGHKADFGILAADPNPAVVDGMHERLLASPLGSALVPAWSFLSLTEVSEYLPTPEHYGRQLAAKAVEVDSPTYETKMKQYARRWEIMRRQRLTPDLPIWPAVCFYPMNKRRDPEANWFLLDFVERERMMAEHGESGMKFAGKVTQLVTVALGLDDWEWGVTLWGRNAEHLKDIVYRMRFDEASARYAQFGSFYAGHQATALEILEHCRIPARESAT